jgi:hypothetical protein
MNPLIAVFLLVVCLGVVFPVMALRYRALELRHREKMEAFERGIPLPENRPREAGRIVTQPQYLFRGLIWTGLGTALCIILFFVTPIALQRNHWDRFNEMRELSSLHYTHEEMGAWMRESDRRWEDQRQRLRGLSALGLIPAAVGVAYLIFYYEQRRRPMFDPPPVRLVNSDQ